MLPTLEEFRARRDYYQARRRADVLPQRKDEENALKREIALLTRTRDDLRKQKKHNPAIDNDLTALWWRFSEVKGERVMIESDDYMMALMAQIESEAANG